MKLHLGCGKKKWPGFVNVDLKNSDFDCDIRKLPFDNESADEIHAIHVVEHFFITEVMTVLKEWYRVLRRNGTLSIELPCWEKVQEHICRGSGENMTRWPLYGDPSTHVDGIPALHKWCYSSPEMEDMLLEAGFRFVSFETPKFHQPSRDMRLVATK